MHRIFLVGFMGAGKTSVGEVLAQLVSSRFVDLDARLCRRFGMSISEVFERYGETAFRTAETEELAAVATLEDHVVATGGGTFCRAENQRLIEASGGTSVFLDVPWEALKRRLEKDHSGRPLYGDVAAARSLWEERVPLYRLSTLTVALTGNERPDAAAALIAEALRGAPCAT